MGSTSLGRGFLKEDHGTSSSLSSEIESPTARRACRHSRGGSVETSPRPVRPMWALRWRVDGCGRSEAPGAAGLPCEAGDNTSVPARRVKTAAEISPANCGTESPSGDASSGWPAGLTLAPVPVRFALLPPSYPGRPSLSRPIGRDGHEGAWAVGRSRAIRAAPRTECKRGGIHGGDALRKAGSGDARAVPLPGRFHVVRGFHAALSAPRTRAVQFCLRRGRPDRAGTSRSGPPWSGATTKAGRRASVSQRSPSAPTGSPTSSDASGSGGAIP